MNTKNQRQHRHKRIRSKVKGTNKIPRLCVFRSNKHIYGQLIDDDKGKTMVSVKDVDVKEKTANKIEVARSVGKLIAAKATESKINTVIFDRGGYKYHGRVKALAEGAREGGLKF